MVRWKGARWMVLAVCLTACLLAAPAADAAFVFDTKWGTFGTGPGQFNLPKGVAGGVSGDVYVADSSNDRIQRFTSSGTYITQWGTPGSATGRFNTPNMVDVDSAGNVYVADTGNHRIQKFNEDGVFLSQIGAGAGNADGQFHGPYGVAVDSSGNIYVADTTNNRVQKFSPAGAFITKWNGSGQFPSGNFSTPVDVGVGDDGNVYVTDYGHNRIQKFDSSGGFITMWGPGTGPAAMSGPYGIDVDTAGNVYVAESGNNEISKFSSNGTFIEATGSFGSGDGQFRTPTALSLDLLDAPYVADSVNHRVQRFAGARSAIIVRKDSVPNDPQNFDFTAGGGLTPTSFQLDDDGNTGNGHSNVRTFLVDPGSGYSVAEDPAPPGWDAGSATCSDGSSPSSIDVSEGEVVTCTFVNNKRAGLFIVQDSLPDDPQDFSYTAGGGLTPTSFQLDDDGNDSNGLSRVQAFENVPPGSGYSVAQSSTPPGWSTAETSCSDGSSVSNISLSVGETVVCTFSNVSPTAGRIIVVKDAQPNDIQDFSFTAGGGLTPSSFELDDDGDNTNVLSNTRTFIVAPGSGFSLSETVPSGWLLDSATCSDGSPVSNIDVSATETVTCTFTNQRPGSITITKDALPDHEQDFSFTAGGGLSPSSFQLDDDGTGGALSNTRTYNGVEPGSGYLVAEALPAGWAQQSATCSDGSSVTNIDVAPNENIECTFTNEKLTGLIVTLDAQPDDPQDFDFTAGGGLSPSSFQLDDDGNELNTLTSNRTFTDVPAGSGYSLAMASVPGWHQLPATCSDGSPPSNITLSPAETVTCAFTVQRKGSITVVQDTSPDAAEDFGYTTTGLSPTSFQLDDDGNESNALASSIVFGDLVPGPGYGVSQDSAAGWLLDSSICSDGSSPGSITVSPGEQVTCTFTNSQRGRIIVQKDARPNSGADFSFTAGGGLSPSSFQLEDDGDETNALASSRDFIAAPGSGYSVTEGTAPIGWTLASAGCSDGSPVSNIDLAAGEVITCTFLNEGRNGNYVRPKGATPLRAPLVPAYRPCNAPNRTHGPPLAHPSCNPPTPAGTSITIGTPDANGAAANSESFVLLNVLFTAGGVDDTDLRIRTTLTDIRCLPGTTACGNANAAAGPDYTGEVQTVLTLRITDPLSEGESATTVEIPFEVVIGCSSNASTSSGGQCTVDTSADALAPGSAPEGRRSIWQIGEVQVLNGGPDGAVVTTGGNELFMAQGIFVP